MDDEDPAGQPEAENPEHERLFRPASEMTVAEREAAQADIERYWPKFRTPRTPQ